MSNNLLKLAHIVWGAALTMGLCIDVQAAPVNYTRTVLETPAITGPIIKTVTRAGVAHRSSRRTARRVNRRHSYY